MMIDRYLGAYLSARTRVERVGCEGCARSMFGCEKCRKEAAERVAIKRAARRAQMSQQAATS